MKEKCAELEELMPMTHQEFLDEAGDGEFKETMRRVLAELGRLMSCRGCLFLGPSLTHVYTRFFPESAAKGSSKERVHR